MADASVILKWVLPDEVDRENALLLRDRHLSGEDRIAAPELLLYEIANVLSLRWGEIHRAAEGFHKIYAAELELYSFQADNFQRSMGLADRHKITTCDAAYVALAETLHCGFVTADEHLLARLKGFPHVRHLKEATP